MIGVATYTYDEVYRVKTVTDPFGKIVTYEYDAVGNITKIIYPDNKEVIYTYDALNRLQTVTNWLTQVATYTYDDAGRLRNVTNFNGTVTEYGYDDSDRLISLKNRKSETGDVISGYDFILDENGNPTRVTQEEPYKPVVSDKDIDFIYNTFKNRLLSMGLISFTYNDEGELIAEGPANYVFDYEHRLITVSGSDLLQFSYDVMGNRLQVIRNGAVTRYVYDIDGNVLAETDSAGNITRYYIHGLGLLAFITPAGELYTYHYNADGSTIALADINKKVVNKYTYSPLGELTAQKEAIPQPFKYSGQYGTMQEAGGLCFTGDGYYNASAGRFISEAPIGVEAAVNPYAAITASPIDQLAPALSPQLYISSGIYRAAVGSEKGDKGTSYNKQPGGKGPGKGGWWGRLKDFWRNFRKREIVLKDDSGKKIFRISPLGHGKDPGYRNNPWHRGLPHYHRRGAGGIKEHRPWEKWRF